MTMEPKKRRRVVNHGINGSFDDSRPGQQGDVPQAEAGIERADGQETAPEKRGENACESGGEVAEAEIVEALQAISTSTEWSGLLPRPDHFNQYEQQDRAKIIEWADRQIKAEFDDESKRLDRLTDAEIKQGRFGQIASTAIMLSAILAAAVCGISGKGKSAGNVRKAV